MNLRSYRNLIDKINTGTEVTIGFIGGSITQGSLSTTEENCYAYKVFSWFKEKFPNGNFKYLNAGVGGTSSHFGVARVDVDLLQYYPDFVIIDFSVNDENEGFFQETFEGLIYKIINSKNKPAVCILNNVFYDNGKSADDYHIEVGKHYGIPYVSMKATLYQDILEKKYKEEDITPDHLHPNDLGHRLVSVEICKVLSDVLNNSNSNDCLNQSYFEVEKPLTENKYSSAKLLRNDNTDCILDGFEKDITVKVMKDDFFKGGWTASKVGDKIAFEVDSKCLAIQYRKTINKPSPIAKLVIDGKEHSVLLDGNFEEDWGDCLFLENIYQKEEKKKRSIEIEIIEASENDKNPFYLLALITD